MLASSASTLLAGWLPIPSFPKKHVGVLISLQAVAVAWTAMQAALMAILNSADHKLLHFKLEQTDNLNTNKCRL